MYNVPTPGYQILTRSRVAFKVLAGVGTSCHIDMVEMVNLLFYVHDYVFLYCVLFIYLFIRFLQPLSDNNSVETEKSFTRSEYAGYSFQ